MSASAHQQPDDIQLQSAFAVNKSENNVLCGCYEGI